MFGPCTNRIEIQLKSIKDRFQNELTKQLHLTSVFLGLQTAKEPLQSAQEPPRRPQDAQHSRNLGATWGLRGGPRGSKWDEKLEKSGVCCRRAPKTCPDPPQDLFWGGFWQVWGWILMVIEFDVSKNLREIFLD